MIDMDDDVDGGQWTVMLVMVDDIVDNVDDDGDWSWFAPVAQLPHGAFSSADKQ